MNTFIEILIIKVFHIFTMALIILLIIKFVKLSTLNLSFPSLKRITLNVMTKILVTFNQLCTYMETENLFLSEIN